MPIEAKTAEHSIIPNVEQQKRQAQEGGLIALHAIIGSNGELTAAVFCQEEDLTVPITVSWQRPPDLGQQQELQKLISELGEAKLPDQLSKIITSISLLTNNL